ncbi:MULTISPECIES: monovalent cation/H+ antiporter subunit D [Thiorhodovibrio]|uniref:monovalent cation/H+ antiporter subunit D n=1 Tax=Thiorhodovibrio TaxID=61593 RepID=UPI001911B6E4|nr:MULTISPECIES: monovalent cation/H+ antiporter subunit D [Thiorhodovibrio]MBK5969371.1 monovalent cation/H+ antiporter subunit D [Thiorhodovibrio winogradskyi]WPL13346.1 Mrp complex subunit D1 [Thiorhodovibrio litoralis]
MNAPSLPLPLLLPLALGALLLIGARLPLSVQRFIGLLGTLCVLAAALDLLALTAQGDVLATAIGGWPPPLGIVLVCDRLSALMLTLTGLLGTAALLYASGGLDASGRHFHALFQFQLFGLVGTFLTGDLFNLFVFFEVLLIASYGLLMHGGGPARTRAALHYVVLNLVGSSLFLLGAALIYAATGTLNLADLAVRLGQLTPADARLAGAGGLLLFTVFALKAALPPLHAWMVPAYAAASAPVAALFAILTKVGLYAMLRLLSLVPDTGSGSGFAGSTTWLLTGAAVLTITAGSLGALASTRLGTMIGYLVMLSMGTLLAGIAPGTAQGLAAALYYLVHTTLITAGLFMLADLVANGRAQGDRLIIGDPPRDARILAPLFLLGAIAIAGLPPLSGFLGKAWILIAVQDLAATGPAVWPWIWAAVLGSSFVVLLGVSRAGVLLLWRRRGSASRQGSAANAVACRSGLARPALVGTSALLAASPLLMMFAGPLTSFTLATARQTLDNGEYVAAVAGLVPRTSAVNEEGAHR